MAEAPESLQLALPLLVGEDLMPLPEYKAASTLSLGFDGLLSKPLQVYEDLTSGCGGQTWPAGMVLAKHMLRYHREELQGARILEIGAGGGVVGLAVAQGCELEQPLWITDQLEMLDLMAHNVRLNGMQDQVKPFILNWGQPLPKEIQDVKPDVILAADCVYFEPSFPKLLQTLDDLFSLNALARVFFAFKKRRRADMQFLKKAQKTFKVTELHDDDLPIFSRQNLFLYLLTARHNEK